MQISNMLRTMFYMWIGFVLISGCSGSAKVAVTETLEASHAPVEKALLWQISGNELQTPSYLFGTIHLIPAEDYFFPEEARQALYKSRGATFEINMENMFDMSSYVSLFGQAFMPDGLSLEDLLSDEDFALVQDHFSKLGIPFMFLHRLKPMFLSVFAEGDLDMDGLQTGTVKSYEMEIFEMAKAAQKEIGGLETVEYQMSMFDSIPYRVQAEMLVESIKSTDVGGTEFNEMVAMYKAQDIQAMHDMMNTDSQLNQYEDMLLTRRNQNWIPEMQRIMTGQPTFFAVGAGHLGGENGVIALLRQEGYVLTPLSHIMKL
jgi:uncharacterized protein YbaP (TraB family)